MPSVESSHRTATISSPPASSKPFSIPLSTKSRPANSITKPLNPKKRPHSSLADNDSDREDGVQQPQLVSAFDHSAGGAISINQAEQKKEPLTIPSQKNRDWRAESYRRKGKNLLPPDVQKARNGEMRQNGLDAEKNEVSRDFGLSFVKQDLKDGDGDSPMPEIGKDEVLLQVPLEKAKDLDQEALEALTVDGAKKSTLILPASSAGNKGDVLTGLINEDEAFRSDVASRPESATLDDYAAVPVEEFGAALLRGMGWKEGGAIGKGKAQIAKPRDLARRPALLGIGAKEIPGSVEELGAWGKAAKGKRKVDKTYNPVLLKNSVTGEMLTEEELEAKKEDQRREDQDWRERRDRNLAKDEERKARKFLEEGHEGRHRDHSGRRRSVSKERSRHGSSRRDRSRSADRSRRHSSRKDEIGSQLSSRHSSSRRETSRSDERDVSGRRVYIDYDENGRSSSDRRPKDEYNRPDVDDRDDRKGGHRRRRDRHDKDNDYDEYDREAETRRRKEKYAEREDYRLSKASPRRREA